MRLALLLPVLFCVAAPAYAEGARESRYGPTTPRQDTVAAAARYDGPMLGWANKRQAQAASAAPAASVAAQPAPLAAWAGYQAPSTPMTAPEAAPAASQGTPTSLYAAPRPAPMAAAPTQAPVKDWSNYRSPRVTAVAPPPQQTAAAGTAAGPRFYSVDRDYGLTPDAAPRPGPDNR
ncbi:MAG: hypothetical protein J7521_23515, partial [Caulobacter sp.]|nr:hypothetical protein [Caulobacter sp.]